VNLVRTAACCYNPFGLEVTKKVFANLQKAIAHTPRNVVVIMVKLEIASVADSMPSLSLVLRDQTVSGLPDGPRFARDLPPVDRALMARRGGATE